MHSNIAERLVKVRKYLDGETVFLANYSDGLSDVPIDRMIADFDAKRLVASFAGVATGNIASILLTLHLKGLRQG